MAAHEFFSSQGFRGASMRDVATRVGLTLPGLLHHFPSKEALLEGVLQERDDTDTPWFLNKWEETGSFRQAMKELVRRNLENREMVQLFTTLSAEATDPGHPAHDYFKGRYEESRELFSRTLATARRRGEARAGASGPVLIAVMDGLQVQWLLDPEFDFLGQLDRYLDTILIDEPPKKKK
jgi:AcrR family transcriptional regulator